MVISDSNHFLYFLTSNISLYNFLFSSRHTIYFFYSYYLLVFNNAIYFTLKSSFFYTIFNCYIYGIAAVYKLTITMIYLLEFRDSALMNAFSW